MDTGQKYENNLMKNEVGNPYVINNSDIHSNFFITCQLYSYLSNTICTINSGIIIKAYNWF